jgi:hypothetical protein
MPPRLNNVGWLFRRFGFRLPDSDDSGKFVLKVAPAHGIGDAAAMIAGFALRNDPTAEPGTTRTTLQMSEVAVIAGSAIGEHFSTQAIFIPRSTEGEVGLEDIELQGNYGTPESQGSLRAGLAQTNLWHKANDGALTLSSPMIFDEAPIGSVGDFAGFSLGAKQVEVEAGYTMTKLDKGKINSTMLSAAVLNGVQQDGSTATRNTTDGVDIFLQAHELWGSRNTVGAFYYHGRTLIDAASALDPPGPFKDTYTRYGVLGNYSPVECADIVASYTAGQDSSAQLGRIVKNHGVFAELDLTLLSNLVGVYRWEAVTPDQDDDAGVLHANVLSSTCQIEDNLFLTLEYQEAGTATQKSHSIVGLVRIIY